MPCLPVSTRVDAQPLAPDDDIVLILHTLYHIQLKKAFEALFTIRTVSNNLSDDHAVVVVWMVSSMKELLHFPNQLLPMAIHQSVSTRPCILLVKVESTVEVVYVMFSLDVTNYASEAR